MKRIVLYYPIQLDPRRGQAVSMDLLPLSLLSLAGWPDRDGYEVVLIDGNLHSQQEAHRRVAEACEGALLFATTGILGYQVSDAYLCARRVKATNPGVKMVIGGWFASVLPELELETGLYDAVCLGQGEMTFREVVHAVDAGEPLDQVAGLALLRDGRVMYTDHRPVVGWDALLNCPWHLLDIEPYREAQMTWVPGRQVERMAVPPGFSGKPFFGISYFSSFGCPEPCTFCCSPGVSNQRWKCMPAERMLDDICGLHDRWGFDTLRFYDANWGVSEKRARSFCEGLLERDERFWWYPFMQSNSVIHYKESTLDLLPESGVYVALLGGETGDEETLKRVGKHTPVGANVAASAALGARGVCTLVTYIIGFPGEPPESMLNTIEEARRINSTCKYARATVWPYRPIPGTAFYQPAIEAGWVPPRDLMEWGQGDEYQVRETWPGQIPRDILRKRRMFEHFSTVSLGLVRGRIGWWERHAKRRIIEGDYRWGELEAKAFDLVNRLLPKDPYAEQGDFVRPGVQTSVLAGRAGAMG